MQFLLKCNATLVIAMMSMAFFASQQVHANSEITIDLTANGTGQFIDYFSAGYAQINLDPDGMYPIGSSTPPTQGSPVDGFPSEGNWAAVGTLTLDSTATGSGVETLNVASATFDFNQYVDGATLAIAGTAYSTSVTITSGTVELTNGIVTDITLDSDIAFTFGAFPANPFNGSFDISGGTFDLFVDDTENVGLDVRQAWVFDGTASSPTVIPEPASLMLLATGACSMFIRRRK